ncbi:Bug family tripartite tricarboxylate transporter substrate binding protein [Parapusillimonas sp. JC17]|uniref:Bug family tripartite tricarboxylate transporter substrate binding protein n=1 Tax=Parapusillimonas sp. JC17 TaxID=3445768 RepID=UPI003F9EE2A4
MDLNLKRATIHGIVAASTLCMAPIAADAQTYPGKAVRVIVPFNAGGSTDVVARAVAQRLGKQLGQSFVVENKGGAGSVNYDPVKDFAPITNIAFMPMVLFVNSGFPAKTVADIVATAKAAPGKHTYASSGNGGPPHFAGALFTNLADIDLTHVPYGGAAPALIDVASGRVDMSFTTFSSAMAFMKSGQLQPVAIASHERFQGFPDVPTFEEAGLKGLDMSTMYALLAPAGTPRPIVDKLYESVMTLLKDPEIRKLIVDQGAQIVGNTPDEFAEFVKADVARWAKLAWETEGVTPQ